jgi:hypothetical protein
VSDPNHMHEFNPSRRGVCKTIIGSRICGGSEADAAHVLYEQNRVHAPFENFEVRESESFDAFHIHFHGVRATEEMRQFVEDAIREKLESL